MSKITFFKDTELSYLNILKAKTNNCWVAERRGLYIKHQILVCGSRGHSIMCSPCERLLGWVPSTSQWEKCWGRENLCVLTFGKSAECSGCREHFTPKTFAASSTSLFLSLQALISLLSHPQVLSQQLWSRDTNAWVWFNMEHRYPSLHASKQPPSSNPSFLFAYKKA